MAVATVAAAPAHANASASEAWGLFDNSGSSSDDADAGVCGGIGVGDDDPMLPGLPQVDDNLLGAILAAAADTLNLMRQQLPAVCRRFAAVLLREPACWQRLEVPLLPAAGGLRCAALTDALVARLARAHGRQLRRVALDGARLLGHDAVSSLAHHCPALASCALVGCARVGSATIRFLVRRCPRLEVLRVAGCSAVDRPGAGAADGAVRAMASGLPLLRSVSLSGIERDETVAALLAGCPRLTALDLAGCADLPCAHAVLGRALAAAQGRLRSLKLGGCGKLASLRGLGRCRQLETLFLGGCDGLGDGGGLGAVLAGCAGALRLLSLVGCTSLSAAGIEAALRRCPGGLPALQSLVLGGCDVDDAGVLRAVAAACPALVSIDLWNCGGVTAVGVAALTAGCARLSSINLRECRNCEGSVLRTSALPPLHTLDFGFAGALEDADLQAALVGPHMQSSLRCLNVGGPACRITERSLAALPPCLAALDLSECASIRRFGALERLGQLHSLSLEGCDVPAEELLRICAACPLTSLNVAEAKQLGDATLVAVVRALPRLLSLELRGCRALSDAGIRALVAGCPRLVLLGLGDCTGVTHAAVAAAAKALPACDIVTHTVHSAS
jgi:hypothetical protein